MSDKIRELKVLIEKSKVRRRVERLKVRKTYGIYFQGLKLFEYLPGNSELTFRDLRDPYVTVTLKLDDANVTFSTSEYSKKTCDVPQTIEKLEQAFSNTKLFLGIFDELFSCVNFDTSKLDLYKKFEQASFKKTIGVHSTSFEVSAPGRKKHAVVVFLTKDSYKLLINSKTPCYVSSSSSALQSIQDIIDEKIKYDKIILELKNLPQPIYEEMVGEVTPWYDLIFDALILRYSELDV